MSRVLKVDELCDIERISGSGKIINVKDFRHILYKTEKETLVDALVDYEENFDFDNVLETYDDFEEECLDSEVVIVGWEESFDIYN